MELIIFILSGLTAGILAGLLGAGGGIIVVPVLYFLFNYHHFPNYIIMHMAIGTSLMVMCFSAASSVFAHHKNTNILWPILLRFIPGIALGAVIAACITNMIPSGILHKLFIAFIFISAIQVALKLQPKGERNLPKLAGLTIVGTIIGSIATLLGIGGSILSVPFLLYCRVKIKNAVALASGGSLPVALVGAVGFMIAGYHQAGLPAWSTGYIYWPAVAGIAIGSLTGSPIGAKLAILLPEKVLRMVFVLFLLVVGILMLLKS